MPANNPLCNRLLQFAIGVSPLILLANFNVADHVGNNELLALFHAIELVRNGHANDSLLEIETQIMRILCSVACGTISAGEIARIFSDKPESIGIDYEAMLECFGPNGMPYTFVFCPSYTHFYSDNMRAARTDNRRRGFHRMDSR